jgi:hypothetical protein
VSYFCNFHATAQSNQSHIGRKFDQSGHPVGRQHLGFSLQHSQNGDLINVPVSQQGCQIFLAPNKPNWEKYTK